MQILKKLENDGKQMLSRKMVGHPMRMMHKGVHRAAKNNQMMAAQMMAQAMPNASPAPTVNTIERVAKRIRN